MVQTFGPITIGLTAASLAISTMGVWISIRFAHRSGVLDFPNERSSHTIPTPRMGGVPMVVAVFLAFGGWVFLSAGEIFSLNELSSSILFVFAMSILGLWDDLSGLSPLTRLLFQFSGAVMVLWTWVEFIPNIYIGVVFPQIIWILTGAFLIVWMLNLYNFMDGIDGLAGGEAVLTSFFFFLVFSWYGETGWAVLNLFISAASMGFLVYNWHPARVFMGDAGSGFLGAFYGMQSVAAGLSTPLPFLVLVLPFSNFILDTTATLLRRAWRGEKWYTAHRSHYYQRMIDLGMSHARVTGLELISVALSCLAALLYLRSGGGGRIVIISSVLVGFTAAGVWISKKSPI